MTHVYQETTDSLNAGEDNPAEDTAGGIHDYESIRAAEAAEDIQAAGAEEAL